MNKHLEILKKEMILCYGITCWLGCFKDENLTGHHIIPIRDGGITTWNNIALLNRKQHDLFNLIEQYYPQKAKELNILFYELNKTYKPPTKDYKDEIKRILNDIDNQKLYKLTENEYLAQYGNQMYNYIDTEDIKIVRRRII